MYKDRSRYNLINAIVSVLFHKYFERLKTVKMGKNRRRVDKNSESQQIDKPK